MQPRRNCKYNAWNCFPFLLGYACKRTTATWHGGNAKNEERFFLSLCSCKKIVTCSGCTIFGLLGNLVEKPRKWMDRIFILPACFLCVCLSKRQEALWKTQLWAQHWRQERTAKGCYDQKQENYFCSFPAMLQEVNQLHRHEQFSKYPTTVLAAAAASHSLPFKDFI